MIYLMLDTEDEFVLALRFLHGYNFTWKDMKDSRPSYRWWVESLHGYTFYLGIDVNNLTYDKVFKPDSDEYFMYDDNWERKVAFAIYEKNYKLCDFDGMRMNDE